MTRYVSKPIEIDAWKHDQGLPPSWIDRSVAGDILRFIGPDKSRGTVWNTQEKIWIPFTPAHWLILGTAGELYPCSDEVFTRKYERVG